MNPEELIAKAGEQLSVRRVFGAPIEHDGVLVIPVAVAVGGGGGASDAGAQPAAGGYGGMVRGIGVYVVREGAVRFVPAIDTVALAGIAWLTVRTLTGAARA